MSYSKPHILLVDDDPGLLRLISMRLNASGYEVESVESGEQALARLTVSMPNVVITDLRMGGMDGMTLFDAIHKTNPTLPVVILTAHGSIPDAVDATKRGVFGFLTKPFESKALLSQVEAAIKLGGATGVNPGEKDSTWRKELLTRSPVMEDVLSQARLVAESDASVLIHGESGTGKELLANAIHLASSRSSKPFVAINCGAIPENLLESELFGYTKGSFTGATQDRKGLFQAANGGTLFLDEIGDMPLALQVKLLRVLQEKQLRPVGSTQSIAVDVRIISATHHTLEDQMEAGKFREDLYYRLNVVSLKIPPLSARREDIPLLAGHFLKTLSAKYNKNINGFAPEALEQLVSAPWPGNVRQLLNVVEQAVALCTTPIVPVTLVQKALHGDEEGGYSSLADAKKQFEREYLAQLLKITSGNVTQAARLAKRNRTEFYKLLKRHALDPHLFKSGKP
ncbi:MAG TPA: sigma 54-interacting transcriptional regulator [Burkholderiales bacterium]|nr:sigma 54-interacting transcriptional regulator [Burkholderiales bacterium]